MAWGRRRAGSGLPAPPLAVPDTYIPLHLQSDADTTGPTSKAFTSIAKASENARSRRVDDEELYQVEIYNSKEESLDAVRRRMALRELVGPSIVTQLFSQL